MEPEAIFVRLLFRNVPWTPIQAGLARENEKASSKRDIKPPRNEEFVMEMKGITLYTSPPCKQDLPARNGLRGNLSHARNGRGIKFSFPILSPASKKKNRVTFYEDELLLFTEPLHPDSAQEFNFPISHLLPLRSRLSDPRRPCPPLQAEEKGQFSYRLTAIKIS